MRTQQSRQTGKVDSSEILRCRRILQIQREDAMRSLDRLGDETRSLDSDCPKDVGVFVRQICLRKLSFNKGTNDN